MNRHQLKALFQLYMEQLYRLQDWLETSVFDVEPWIERVKQRPVLPLNWAYLEAAKKRNVGCLFAFDVNGRVIDALAIDDTGASACANGAPVVDTVAGEWAAYSEKERPKLEDYVADLMRRGFYGGYFGHGNVLVKEGTVDEIARRMLGQENKAGS